MLGCATRVQRLPCPVTRPLRLRMPAIRSSPGSMLSKKSLPGAGFVFVEDLDGRSLVERGVQRAGSSRRRR